MNEFTVVRNRVGNCWQSTAIFGNAQGFPILSEVGAYFCHVGMEYFVSWQGVARSVPPFLAAAMQDRSMLTRAGVEPSAWTTYLSAKLNQRDIEWREHQWPFFLDEQ